MTDVEAPLVPDTASRVKRKFQLPDGRVEPFPILRFMEFCKTLKVQTKDYGLVSLELLGSQMYVLKEIVDGIRDGVTTFVILKARQLGISTFFLALDLFWAFEHEGLLGIFATHDEGSRDQFRNQIDIFLKTLPPSHRIEYETNNRLMLVLKNQSLFRYLVAGTRTTTNKLGRSGGCNFAHSTECAFWGSAEDLKAMMQTFSELYPYRLYFFESTANGFNHYADMCETAKLSPAQKFIFIGWWRDERNEFDKKHPLYLKYMPQGTKTPMTQLEQKRVKEVKEQYKFQITAGQLAWYRFHLETKCGGDQSAMDQEMPWTAEDAFVATGSTFFANDTLTKHMRAAKTSLCMPFMIKLTDNFEDTRAVGCTIERAELKIWQKPVVGGKYVVGADPIFGSSPDSNNGVVSVYRCYADSCEQVAEYCSPTVTTYQFAWVLAFLCGLYRDTYLVLEMTGPGTPVHGELKQLKQKMYQTVPSEDNDLRNCLKFMKDFLFRRADSFSASALLQWQSSPKLREQLLHGFHIGVESGRINIKSLMCLEECRHMTVESDGYIGCPSGKQDDRVFGTALAYLGWEKSARPQLLAAGLTKARVLQMDESGTANPIDSIVSKFLKNAKISVKQ